MLRGILHAFCGELRNRRSFWGALVRSRVSDCDGLAVLSIAILVPAVRHEFVS